MVIILKNRKIKTEFNSLYPTKNTNIYNLYDNYNLKQKKVNKDGFNEITKNKHFK